MQAVYIKLLESFEDVVKKPTQFLEANEVLSLKIKENAKTIYDFLKEESADQSGALRKLLVQDFDVEQIWQQIELQNDLVITQSLGVVSESVVGKAGLVFHQSETYEKSDDEQEEVESEAEESQSCDGKDDVSEQESEPETKIEGKGTRKSAVDDEFFKLDEMENFLKSQEKETIDDDSSDSDSDLLEDVDVENAKYKDFFVRKESKKVKSSFERRQERLEEKIKEIEDEAVAEKPWQLKGEITAEGRPQNSLLQEIVDFDLTSRPAPVITEQTTFQLEDIIRQRIKDKVFDSVERKARAIQTPLEYKKKLVLDQEKSKESLAQIYEKEFLDLQSRDEEKEEVEPQLHKEISSMMNSLFQALDSLGNFHFTPKVVLPELKIVSNLPAVNMEEVAPVSVTDANLLAPEEVKSRVRGDAMGKSERTSTDKKRERRKKKAKQKMHANIARTKKEHVERKGKVERMKETSEGVKSSKAFFAKLEEQTKSQVPKRKVESSKHNAKRLKF